jgi:hypothetical protein
VCFVLLHSSQDHLEQEHAILTTLYLTGTKNVNSWRARKGNLQHALLLHCFDGSIIGVHRHYRRCAPTMRCFSLGETIRFKSLEFIANRFGGMSLPLKDGSGAIIMGPACGEPPLLQQTMMGGPIEGSTRLLMGKGGPASPSHGDAAWRFLPLQPRPYHGRRTLWLIKL